MTKVEINTTLAEAVGWVKYEAGSSHAQTSDYFVCAERGRTRVVKCWDTRQDEWRTFDYKDPVVFAAICAHWGMTATRETCRCYCAPDFKVFIDPCIEKAAALCALAAAEQGHKRKSGP